jgi:WXG100 family type VII secretion target
MAEIKVTSGTLRTKANSIKGISASIRNLETEIQSEVTRLKPAWEGEASENFQKNYTRIGEKLKGIHETITKYSTFLEEAAEGFAQAEAASISDTQAVG